MAYYSRHLVPTIRRALTTFPALLLTGPRQAGKSTLLRQELAATHRYLSLERPDLRARAAADPVAFLAENPPPLILDEIQQLPELLSWLQERIDAQRTPGQYVLSGSQSFALMEGVSQTLAGRIAILTLLPLSMGELRVIAPRSIDQQLARVFDDPLPPPGSSPESSLAPPLDAHDWLLRGGYPELRANSDVDRSLWFASYVQTYLERDVRDLLQVGDLRD